MAIAGLLVMTQHEQTSTVFDFLAQQPDITDVQHSAEECRLAAVLEQPSDAVEKRIAELLRADGVLTVDIAFLSYEDDLADKGYIPCPPHSPRKHGRK